MRITFSGRRVSVTDPMREYAAEKLARIERRLDRIQSVRVTFAGRTPPRSVSIRLSAARGAPILAEGEGKDFLAAVDRAVERIERQVERHKAKRRGARGGR